MDATSSSPISSSLSPVSCGGSSTITILAPTVTASSAASKGSQSDVEALAIAVS